MTITNPIPLAKFRTAQRQTVAKLQGMKSIMRVDTPRTRSWWLVLPARGDKDSICVLLHKDRVLAEFKGHRLDQSMISGTENWIMTEYADRIAKA